MSASSTADVRNVTTTRPTDDLPDFVQVVAPAPGAFDEILEDGLAIRQEIDLYRYRASSSLPELDDFFESLE